MTGPPKVEAIRDTNILFLTHYFTPEGNAPASRVHEMCKRWVRDGCRVTVITCAPNVPDGRVYEGYTNRLTQTETIDGIRVIRVWTFLAANKGIVLRMLNYVSFMFSAATRALFLERPDVIIATSPQLFCGWAGVITGWFRRRPMILEMRDLWAESIVTVTTVRRGMLQRMLEWLEFRMYASARHIVTVGEGYARQLIARGVPAGRIAIVTNGVDREFFAPRPPDRELAERIGVAGRFVCSYVGTIGMAAGLDVVIRAGIKLRDRGRGDIVFLLVGDGANREALAARVAELKLDNVILVGRQAKSSIPAFLSVSDCCLVHLRRAPLFTTVLPSKIFEASYMKRPIVLGVEGEAARVVTASEGGICIEPDNEDQLIAAVERLADDPGLRSRLGQAGHDYIARHYDRDQLARDYLAIIDQVAASKR